MCRLTCARPSTRCLLDLGGGTGAATWAAPAGDITDEVVSKRQGERYRAARDLAWGDAWPPAGPDPDVRSPVASGHATRPGPAASAADQ